MQKENKVQEERLSEESALNQLKIELELLNTFELFIKMTKERTESLINYYKQKTDGTKTI